MLKKYFNAINSITIISLFSLSLCGCQSILPPGISNNTGAIPPSGKFIAIINKNVISEDSQTISDLQIKRHILSSTNGILKDLEFETYCDTIVNRLLISWPYNKPKIHIFIVPRHSFESDTTPDGGIIITTGLLSYFAQNHAPDDVDRFAFILAHEVSHILMGQINNRDKTAKNVNAIRGYLELASELASKTKYAAVAQDANDTLMAVYLLGKADNSIFFPSWQRSQESQADLLAIDLMAQSGFNLEGATDILKVLIQEDKQAESREPPERNFTDYIKTQKIGNAQEYNLDFNNYLTPYLHRVAKSIAASHPDSKSRYKTVVAYIAREYPNYLSRESSASFDHQIASMPLHQVIADEEKLVDADIDIQSKKFVLASQTLNDIHSIILRNSEYFYYLKVTDELNLGQTTTALENLRVAINNPFVTQPIYALQANILRAQNNNLAALAAYKAADDDFETEEFLPQRISINKSLNNNAEVNLLLIKCNASGDEVLAQECFNSNK